jgi:hypothetical protein
MSLTSYRAAPPRVTNWLRVAAFRVLGGFVRLGTLCLVALSARLCATLEEQKAAAR